MPLLLFGLFIVVPVVEIWLIVQVGQAIGVIPTIVLLLLDGILGSWLVRREGRKAWAALRDATAAGRVPAKEAADGALVLVGGAFLLAPGFLTDAVGLLCILPVTRPLLRGAIWRFVTGRVVVLGPLANARQRRTRVVDSQVLREPVFREPLVARDDDVVEGEIVDPGRDD
jgi:UPF0716 protein FxsA